MKRTLAQDLAEDKAINTLYKDSEGRCYIPLEINDVRNTMLVDVGGTDRLLPLSPHLRDLRDQSVEYTEDRRSS